MKTAASWVAGSVLLAACAGDHGPDGEVSLTQEKLREGQLAAFGSVAWEYIADPNYEHLTERLDSLAGHGLSLTINVPSSQIDVMAGPGSPWPAIDAALERNISVSLWLTLPEFPTPMSRYTKALDPDGSRYHADPAYRTTGYFANQSNAVEFVAQAEALAERFAARYPGKQGAMLVDMEIRKELMPLYNVTDVLENQLDFFQRYGGLGRAAEYDSALTTYKAFVNTMRDAGWRMDVSTFVQFLDDYADGDASLRRAYGAVLDDPSRSGATNWSHVYFQAFTTLYGAALPITNYFVYDYARLARTLFRDRASIVVGLTHGGIDLDAPTYWSPIALAADTSAALAAGIPRASIEVYSFLGMLDAPGSDTPEGWLIPLAPWNPPPLPDLGTPLMHAVDHATDAFFPTE